VNVVFFFVVCGSVLMYLRAELSAQVSQILEQSGSIGADGNPSRRVSGDNLTSQG
jgi:hypothetical protein